MSMRIRIRTIRRTMMRPTMKTITIIMNRKIIFNYNENDDKDKDNDENDKLR